VYHVANPGSEPGSPVPEIEAMTILPCRQGKVVCCVIFFESMIDFNVFLLHLPISLKHTHIVLQYELSYKNTTPVKSLKTLHPGESRTCDLLLPRKIQAEKTRPKN
jgi:hypothetical protein